MVHIGKLKAALVLEVISVITEVAYHQAYLLLVLGQSACFCLCHFKSVKQNAEAADLALHREPKSVTPTALRQDLKYRNSFHNQQFTLNTFVHYLQQTL